MNVYPLRALGASLCTARLACVFGAQIKPGQLIVADEPSGWLHVECRAEQLLAEYDAVQDARGSWVGSIASADAVMMGAAAQKASQTPPQPRESRPALPVGRYTVTPADERQHVVIDVDEPGFGSFPDGTRKVSVHGSFAVKRNGMSEHRSWYGFGLIRDGRLSLFKNARAIMEASPSSLSAEDQVIRAKVERAAKATRFLLDGTISDILEAGKAYARIENHCFVCRRPLNDPESQERGVGPICYKRISEAYGV